MVTWKTSYEQRLTCFTLSRGDILRKAKGLMKTFEAGSTRMLGRVVSIIIFLKQGEKSNGGTFAGHCF